MDAPNQPRNLQLPITATHLQLCFSEEMPSAVSTPNLDPTMTSPLAVSRSRDRFYELDLFRFIAALFIVLHHYLFRGQAEGGYSPVTFAPWLTTLGQYTTGFNFFFMTTGFLLLMNTGSKSPRQFVISRVQRLYPALWVCCTITYLLSLLTQNPRFMVSPLDYLANLTMLNGFLGIPYVDGAYWTMVISFKFNLLLLLVMILGQVKHMYWLTCAWLVYSALFIFIKIPYVDFFFLSSHAPFFIAGMIIYLIHRDGQKLHYWLLFAASYLVALYYVVQDASAKEAYYQVPYSNTVFILINSVYFFMFVLIALGKTKWLQVPFFATLGLITYPLFLLHQNIGFMAFTYLPVNKYLLLIVLLIVMFSLSYAVYRFAEKPFAKPFGAWLNSVLPGRPNHPKTQPVRK
jgi:peptidoglycan/LPS O-acetylase OafA/YrhL